MIADIEGWRKWEAEQMAAEPVDHERNLRWFEAALDHAVRSAPCRPPIPWMALTKSSSTSTACMR